MKHVLATITLTLAAIGADAGEQLPLVQPPGNKLVVTKVEREHGLYAEFHGRIWVSGTLVAQWIRGTDQETANTLDIRLLPDQRSVNQLPSFERYPVSKIDLTNEKEALRMAVSASVLGRFETKQVERVEAAGTFLLEQYVVGVECDASWAKATVVRAHIPKPLRLAGTPEPFGC